jgi:hypothetical protein
VAGLTRGKRGEFAQPAAHGDDLLADLDADLGDDAQHVALGGGRGRSDDEIRAAEKVEVQRVVLGHEGRVDQLADLPAGGRGRDLIQVVERLGGGHVVGGGADAADARGDLRHVLGRTALGEFLEAAQLGHLKEGALDLPRVVEEDIDFAVALEARDGVDGDSSCAG